MDFTVAEKLIRLKSSEMAFLTPRRYSFRPEVADGIRRSYGECHFFVHSTHFQLDMHRFQLLNVLSKAFSDNSDPKTRQRRITATVTI